MPRKRYRAEEISHKLREAEVALLRGSRPQRLTRSVALPSRPTTAGGVNMVDQAKKLN